MFISPWIISVFSNTSSSPKFTLLWAGATDSQGSHSHTVSGTSGAGSAHSHTLTGASAASAGGHSHTISFTVTSGTASSLPPYYALCYIMKL